MREQLKKCLLEMGFEECTYYNYVYQTDNTANAFSEVHFLISVFCSSLEYVNEIYQRTGQLAAHVSLGRHFNYHMPDYVLHYRYDMEDLDDN